MDEVEYNFWKAECPECMKYDPTWKEVNRVQTQEMLKTRSLMVCRDCGRPILDQDDKRIIAETKSHINGNEEGYCGPEF